MVLPTPMAPPIGAMVTEPTSDAPPPLPPVGVPEPDVPVALARSTGTPSVHERTPHRSTNQQAKRVSMALARRAIGRDAWFGTVRAGRR